jgi:chemotaxis protein methyltransferase CheR
MATREARASDDPALVALVEELWDRHGLDYRGWTAERVAARLGELIGRAGLADLYSLRLRLGDVGWLERVVAALAARPGGPFADVALYRALRDELCPRLRTYPSFRIWHAGCASGEDAYATAIVLREEGLRERGHVYGTDQHDALVARAREGRSEAAGPEAVARYAEAGGRASLAEYYQVRDGGLVARESLRERMVFAVHSLATDASFNEFNLVICRGVLPAFAPALRERALGLFGASLCRFGYLALGRGEGAGLTPPRDRFEPVRWADDVFRKVA